MRQTDTGKQVETMMLLYSTFGFVNTSLRPCLNMGWLRLVGSLKLYVSFAKEPYKTVDILQKRPMIGTENTEYIWDAKTLQLIGSFKL